MSVVWVLLSLCGLLCIWVCFSVVCVVVRVSGSWVGLWVRVVWCVCLVVLM